MLIKNTSTYGTDQIKMLVYGESGNGKTHLAKTCGPDCIVLSAEGGLMSLKGSSIPYIDITVSDDGSLITDKAKRWDRLKEALVYLNSDDARKKYKWIFIDSITEISQIVVEKLKLDYPNAKDAFPMWGAYSEQMRALIKALRDIPNYHVVFVCLPTKEKDELGKTIMGLDVQGKIGHQLPGYVDLVMYLGVKEEEVGKKKRFLVTQPSDKLIAKDRSGKLNQFEEADLGKIVAKINGKGETK